MRVRREGKSFVGEQYVRATKYWRRQRLHTAVLRERGERPDPGVPRIPPPPPLAGTPNILPCDKSASLCIKRKRAPATQRAAVCNRPAVRVRVTDDPSLEAWLASAGRGMSNAPSDKTLLGFFAGLPVSRRAIHAWDWLERCRPLRTGVAGTRGSA